MTREQLEALIERFSTKLSEGMDLKTAQDFVYDTTVDALGDMFEDEVVEIIENGLYPEVLDEI